LNNYVLPVITAILLLGLFYAYRKLGYSFVSFFAFAVGVLGISISLTLYDSFSEFWDDLGPELIGLTFDIGLLYIFLEFLRRRDEQREKEEKEKSVVMEYLYHQLINLVGFISLKYYYIMTGRQPLYISKEDIEEIVESDNPLDLLRINDKMLEFVTAVSVDDLYLYRFFYTSEQRMNRDKFAVVVSEFDVHFRIPAQKQIEKFIMIYQKIIPDELYGKLLKLNHLLTNSSKLTKIYGMHGLKREKMLAIKQEYIDNIGTAIIALHNYQEKLSESIKNASESPSKNTYQKIKTKFESIFRRPKNK
jgi:hypothetical protein